MTRARTRKAAVSDPAWVIPLAEWRGAYRAIMASGWWRLFSGTRNATAAARRRACFIATATNLLPASWHAAHQGRLGDDHRRQVQNWLNVHRPIYRAPRPTVPQDYGR